jgi:hypothetical protein
VRTLVGSIGLVLSVPLTTAVGVALVRYASGPVHQRSATAPAWDPTWTDGPSMSAAPADPR